MNSQPKSYTHCQAAHASAQTKASQRVCLSHPDKIELKKISFPSENKKYPTALPNTTQTMTLKLNNDNGLKRWTDRRPTGNMRLASCGVKCLNSSAVFQINFSAWLTVLCPEIPHERQAPNRQAVKKVIFF